MLEVLKDICKSPSIFEFKRLLQSCSSLLFENIWDGPKSVLISLAAAQNKNIVILTGGVREDHLFENLSFFTRAPLEFPSWETLPSEGIAPSPDIIGKRLEVLYSLTQKKGPHIILCSLQSLLQKIPKKESLKDQFYLFSVRDFLDFENFPILLTSLQYTRETVVSDKGQFAVRGGIVDLFPISSSDPYRIEFFGNEIESIRTFDPIGQKSTEKKKSFFLTPAKEDPFLEKKLVSLFDYLEGETLLIVDDLLQVEDRLISLKRLSQSSNRQFFFSFSDLLQKNHTIRKIFFAKESIEELSSLTKGKKERFFEEITFDMFSQKLSAKRFFHTFMQPVSFFGSDETTNIFKGICSFADSKLKLIFVNTTSQQEAYLKKQLAPFKLPADTHFEKGYLASGFVLKDLPFAIVPEVEWTQNQRVRRQKWRNTYHTPAAEFHELTPGDLVVHFHSGIGKYLGTEKQVNHLKQKSEFIVIEYAENSKLYVPLTQAHLVSRYIGSNETAPSLSNLGTKRWEQTKTRAQKQIIGYASDLLHLYAERQIEGGFRYAHDSDEMSQFEKDFPYEETQDQLEAISALKRDMFSEKAMDRLICGDVGYGKTEVAMRAAFKAAFDGKKQVAVLVPTTVLTLQHYDTFRQRMQGYPLEISALSRFSTPKENRKTLERIDQGNVDIVIGTHRMLSKDVHFKKLGLIIIDEEQRFGVRAKEHLKKMKKGVDCLTLTATPIPRTLYMSLINIREISIISSPPHDRLPTKTILCENEDTMITDAILRELSREGQVFFIHNRVETIYRRANHIQELVPQAKIAIVHGQMNADAIDRIFHSFKQGKADILFATTIIENGIDVPNANTIFIDRADTFGIADLYQLRGRVGRWNRTAYAYFLTPQNRTLPEVAQKRLNALLEAGGYGTGMKIAMRDLEIRGAGDILGVQQSGQISAIGFHLYCKLLKRTVDSLKKKAPVSFVETKVEFPFDASIPEDYITEVALRMEMYHRFGDATSLKEIDSIFDEIKDRFGVPPKPVVRLHHLMRIRCLVSANQFTLLKITSSSITAEQTKGKKTVKKTLPLPVKPSNASELEEIVQLMLKNHFELPHG